jgi:hypothetical protein
MINLYSIVHLQIGDAYMLLRHLSTGLSDKTGQGNTSLLGFAMHDAMVASIIAPKQMAYTRL